MFFLVLRYKNKMKIGNVIINNGNLKIWCCRGDPLKFIRCFEKQPLNFSVVPFLCIIKTIMLEYV